MNSSVAALHQGLSKYLTAQDTHITPTLIKHHKTALPPTPVHYTNK